MSGRPAALSLYRSILRAHSNYLPPQMKQLGDSYVKNEFREHKDATNPEQLGQFFTAWEAYLDQVRNAGRAKGAVSTGVLDERPNVSGIAEEEEGSASPTAFKFGTNLPESSELSDDQIQRLEQLRRNVTLDDSSSLPEEETQNAVANGAAPVIEHWKPNK